MLDIGRDRRVLGASALDVLAPMGVVGLVVGAVFGFVVTGAVEFDESANLALAAGAGLWGLVPGSLLGLLVAMPPAGVLLLVRRMNATPVVGVAAAALGAAVAVALLFLLVTGFDVAISAVVVCTLVAVSSAAVTAAWIGRRHP